MQVLPWTKIDSSSPILTSDTVQAAAAMLQSSLLRTCWITCSISVVSCVVGERQVAEFAIDYLDSLSTVPLAERQPQLQQPLYSSLLQVLAPHIQYPPDFTDWDGCVDDDEEAFTRFRPVPSLPVCCVYMCLW